MLDLEILIYENRWCTSAALEVSWKLLSTVILIFSVWRIFGPMNFILYVTWFISQNSKLSKLLWLVGLEIKTETFWFLMITENSWLCVRFKEFLFFDKSESFEL